ncbi:MAG TPA: multicopper oxidase domain-containing protein [Gemmatimonadaceae bacterium]|nr:multicopper oxidase domain-containing protein [Gemmatimonadaceae bacterium]
MRHAAAAVGSALSILSFAHVTRPTAAANPANPALPHITANDNRAPAGVRDGRVLRLRLDLVRGRWFPDGDDKPGTDMVAFAESGHAPSIPGPLVRVPVGTEVRSIVHNTLDSSVVVFGLSGRHARNDTAWIRPGETRELVLHAAAAGSFMYNASYSIRSARDGEDRMMTGALVVVEPNAPPDRVFVLLQMIDTTKIRLSDTVSEELLTINGRPWPYTERLTYDVGDTIRWRIINGSYDTHPMHLHGQYFEVLRRGTPYVDTVYSKDQVRQDVTERMSPLTTMYMRWHPTRAGNWLFHCHLNFHVQSHGPFVQPPGVTLAAQPRAMPMHDEHEAHDMPSMGGLVLGTTVRGPIAPNNAPRRKLHLYVQQYDSVPGDYTPTFSYERADVPKHTRPGAPFVVRQNEPLEITVVNHTKEATSVHWHGLELESYYDGVPAFSGMPEHLTPAIASGDSFVVYMTPPRAGTFIYHTHEDDIRQQAGGLYGAFIVYPAGARWDAAHEVQVIAGTTPRDTVRLDVNAPVIVRVGERYRVRMINITLDRPEAMMVLRRGDAIQRWNLTAKDGADLPPAQAGSRPANMKLSIGETYDAFFTPRVPGTYTFELRTGAGGVLAAAELVVR